MVKSIAELLSEREGTRLDFKRDLRHLREEGVVEFVGELRTGFYERR